MSSFRFLHAADLHIDSPLRGLDAEAEAPAEEIRGATRRAFTNLVDLALREQVAFLLIAGDLFDGDWPDWRTGYFVTRELARLREAKIPVIGIRGNHDAQSIITGHLPAEMIRMLRSDRPESVSLPELGVSIHGQSFARREVRENLAAGYPKPEAGHFNIGLLHTAATGRSGHENYAPCSVEQLAGQGYDYWALGHVHAREVLLQAPTWIVFPGNTQGRDIGESGPKGASLVAVREGQVATVEHRELDVVRWVVLHVALDGASDLEDVMARARRELDAAAAAAGERLLAVRMVLEGASAAHGELVRDFGATRDRLRNEAAAAAGTGLIWLEEMKLHTRPILEAGQLSGNADAVGRLMRAVGDAAPTGFASGMKEYCARLLDKAPRLRQELGERHPAVLAAAGEISPELLERAKNLLLARLAEP